MVLTSAYIGLGGYWLYSQDMKTFTLYMQGKGLGAEDIYRGTFNQYADVSNQYMCERQLADLSRANPKITYQCRKGPYMPGTAGKDVESEWLSWKLKSIKRKVLHAFASKPKIL